MKTIKAKRKELEIKAATLIERKIHEHLKTQDKVVLALCGGRSVSGIFELLKKQNVPWEKVHIFFADEKVIPTDDPNSNYQLAFSSFLEYLTIQHKLPIFNIHPCDFFHMKADLALEGYKNELKEISDKFDIVLLSSGEDGHVGSLFPNHQSINDDSEFFVYIKDSPKAPSKRISASWKLISKSKTALLLFFGKEKKEAYNNLIDKSLSMIECPAKIINNIEDSYVFLDF